MISVQALRPVVSLAVSYLSTSSSRVFISLSSYNLIWMGKGTGNFIASRLSVAVCHFSRFIWIDTSICLKWELLANQFKARELLFGKQASDLRFARKGNYRSRQRSVCDPSGGAFLANRFRRLLAKQKIIEFPTKLEIFAFGALRTIFCEIRGEKLSQPYSQNDAV